MVVLRMSGYLSLVLALAAPVAAADALPDGEWTLVLRAALRRPALAGGERAVDLTVRLTRTGGQWLRDAYATADDYNNGLHPCVATVTAAGGGLTLDLVQTLTRVRGATYGERAGGEGQATFQVQLRPVAAGWAGTYRGRFEERQKGLPRPDGQAYESAGSAELSGGPAWPPPIAGARPAPAGEHPRLFFGPGEVAALRQRAATPQGQAFVARVRELLARNVNGFSWNREGTRAQPYTEGAHAAGQAFLYVLTGDPAAAERARWLTFRAMAANGGEWGAWGNGLRIPSVAVAYDLCYHAWPPAFRDRVAVWLQAAAKGRGDNPDLHFEGMFHAAGGLAALAIVGDACPAPPAPTAPEAARAIPPPANFVPGAGVPVVPFTDGQVSPAWLVAGGFNPGYGGEPLAVLGGPGQARPTAGDTFAQGDFPCTFERRETGARMGLYKFRPNTPRPKGAPPHLAEADEALPLLSYFYAVVDNDRPRAVQALAETWENQYGVVLPVYGLRMWIAGQELANGEVVRLEQGRYPVMVELQFAGQMMAAPRLVDYTAERHQRALADYAAERVAWEAAGRTYPYAAERSRYRARFVRRYLDLCYGDQGFFTEDSNPTDAIYNLLPYAAAFARVTGTDLSAGTGLGRILPTIALTRAKLLRHDWGTGHYRVLGFPPFTDAATQAVLRSDLDAGQPGSQPVASTQPSAAVTEAISLPWDGLFALLNYPWDVPARTRTAAGLPLALADTRQGGFVFSSGLDGPQDVQTLVLLRSRAPVSAVTAGNYSIYSGRAKWTGMANAGGGFFRPACLTAVERPNVLRVAGAIPTRGARLVAHDHPAAGVNVVSFVQDWWVDGSADDAHGSPRVNSPANLGIVARRSIAVDYSGAGGVPAIVAVADHVQVPADRAVWLQMRTPDVGTNNSPWGWQVEGPRMVATPRSPRAAGDLRPAVTMVSSGPAVIEVQKALEDCLVEVGLDEQLPAHFRTVNDRKAREHLATVEAKVDAAEPRRRKADSVEDVLAEVERQADRPASAPSSGPAAPMVERYFLVVWTLHGGDPPAVTVDGAGPAARVKVGARVIRWDGARLVLDQTD